MKNKKLLLVVIVGLLATILLVPGNTMTDKPSHALESSEVQGWWVFNEGFATNNLWYGFNLSMWWQIWINNQTIQVNESAAWNNATKAICIILITFPYDIESEWWLALKVWFQITTYYDVDFDGFDHDLIWEDSGIQLGLATEDENLIFIMGYNETTTPANPFTRWWAVKTPTNSSSVTTADISYMLEAQAGKLHKVPGFEAVTILAILAILTGILFKRRKWQKIIKFYEMR